MQKLIEDHIETMAVGMLQSLGYKYVHAPDIAPDSDAAERKNYDEIILLGRLSHSITRLNPSIPDHAREQALKKVLRIRSPELLTNNETFHRLLTEGVNVTYQKNGQERGDKVWLVDFKNPGNNEFLVVTQFTITENGHNKRLDIILFVNGLPLVVLELKNAADENATIKSAYEQFQTYKSMIPGLFTFNAFLVISDGLEARAGTVSSDFSRFMAWKSADGQDEASHLVSQLVDILADHWNEIPEEFRVKLGLKVGMVPN